jgi:hypothetical protein
MGLAFYPRIRKGDHAGLKTPDGSVTIDRVHPGRIINEHLSNCYRFRASVYHVHAHLTRRWERNALDRQLLDWRKSASENSARPELQKCDDKHDHHE